MALPAPVPTTLPLPHAEAYDEPREYARALMQRKEEIEAEIDALNAVVASHGASSDTPLIDPEGYPRADIDVYAIRHARAALVRLYNDRAEVMRRLAPALESAFEVDQPPSQTQSQGHVQRRPLPPADTNGRAEFPETWPERAVARVNAVAPDSPAADAGLAAGDVVYSFSGITAATPGGMQAIGPVVQRSEGRRLTLLVLRGNERRMLYLTPRTWSGRGLLGCHILPA
ncbi:hypothetical protein CspeluHIS016_0203170 [Cutaneotrichosporon spelunceum]|uniref:Probable 26S proteasome regulatory subunit p27 n=1 Tax=Cutaneotrichosporon spelunceum TaxID=1672016 RepID=A0AAD3TRM5_9TREE|nr:hypothetical protein CspeluHIS016_0203170 [Cutaneotrichosporon spelunceum]